MFQKRTIPQRRRSKKRPKARAELARRIPQAHRIKHKKVRPSVLRRRQEEEQRHTLERLVHLSHSIHLFGFQQEHLLNIEGRQPAPREWAAPSFQKVSWNWKKEGF